MTKLFTLAATITVLSFGVAFAQEGGSYQYTDSASQSLYTQGSPHAFMTSPDAMASVAAHGTAAMTYTPWLVGSIPNGSG